MKERRCRAEHLEEGMSLDVLGPSRPGAQPLVGVLDQQLPQQVLGQGPDHGGEGRLAAQDTPGRNTTGGQGQRELSG